MRQHLELLDGVDWGIGPEGVELGINIVDPIQQETVGIFPGPADIERELASHGTGRAGSRR